MCIGVGLLTESSVCQRQLYYQSDRYSSYDDSQSFIQASSCMTYTQPHQLESVLDPGIVAAYITLEKSLVKCSNYRRFSSLVYFESFTLYFFFLNLNIPFQNSILCLKRSNPWKVSFLSELFAEVHIQESPK